VNEWNALAGTSGLFVWSAAAEALLAALDAQVPFDVTVLGGVDLDQ